MSRWLLLLLLAIILYRLLSGGRAGRRRQASQRQPERMVACTFCGVNVPESEAMLVDGRSFCNEQHRSAWDQSQ